MNSEATGRAAKKATCCRPGGGAGGGNGGAVYGFGLIGAAVYFWRRADSSPRARAIALAKALAWPAFLVYEALDALHGTEEAADASHGKEEDEVES